MSDFDLINFLMIDDVGRSTKNNEKLQDLRDKADFLAKKTGQEPVSWYEFQQNVPKEEPHSVRNLGIGAAIGMGLGALVGGGIGMVAAPAIVSLGFLGAIMGAFSDTQNRRRKDLVEKYETYLNAFEKTGGLGRAYTMEQMPPLREGDKVAQLKEQDCGVCKMRG